MTSIDKYKKREKRYRDLIKKQEKYMKNIIQLQIVIGIAAVLLLIVIYRLKISTIFICVTLLACAVLFSLGLFYSSMERRKKFTREMHNSNLNSIRRLNGEWNLFEDTGKEFINEEHNYSYDLDIFGTGSLFQWMNTCNTYIGRKKLKDMLTKMPEGKEKIYDRQEAASELADNIYFRQRLEAEGIRVINRRENPDELFRWMKNINWNVVNKYKIFGVRILSTITGIFSIILIIKMIVLLFSYILDIEIYIPKIFDALPNYIPGILIVVQSIILETKNTDRNNSLKIAEKYNDSVGAYKNMLLYIEKHKFKSEYILKMYKDLYDDDGKKASDNIKRFSGICEFIASRRNMVYKIFNYIFMLDCHLAIQLELWKIKNGMNFEKWLDVVAEIEALCSIANIKYDNPSWNMPKIEDKKTRIIAENIGHPLLGEKRVSNSIKVEEPHEVILITGSNMSGKSTFMRTVGINIILAYAGAPVCADKFSCSIMNLYTCMKINDNLGEGISSFYAEMLKIRNIVEASKEGKPILFILDEIFKGTNSKDRHTGAKILIKQLSKKGNIGFVSTHDMELGEMEKESNSKVKNYHFSEDYKDNEICFDYKLKPGISTTRNAVYLMKMAGIEIEK